jgi:hypothetical protein
VRELARILKDMLDPEAGDGSLANQVESRAVELFDAANEALGPRAQQISIGPAGRKVCVDAYVLALNTIEELELVHKKVGGVLDDLTSADDTMAQLLRSDSIDRSQITAFYKKVKDLLDQLKVLV